MDWMRKVEYLDWMRKETIDCWWLDVHLSVREIKIELGLMIKGCWGMIIEIEIIEILLLCFVEPAGPPQW